MMLFMKKYLVIFCMYWKYSAKQQLLHTMITMLILMIYCLVSHSMSDVNFKIISYRASPILPDLGTYGIWYGTTRLAWSGFQMIDCLSRHTHLFIYFYFLYVYTLELVPSHLLASDINQVIQ